ncbi:MAG TPA: peptidoglycan-binding protein, partial [Vicinamibacterales bacterium]|nr:peptidoglycan-binding protein [Vicinamibacterales bacterium]
MTAERRSSPGRYRLWPLVGACAAVALGAAVLTWAMTRPASQSPGPVLDPATAAPAPAPAQVPVAPQPLAEAVRALDASMAERTALHELYGSEAVLPLWFAGGAITPDGQALVTRLRGAARHGLEPAGYLVGTWLERGGELRVPADPAAAAAADAALSLGVLRYMRHLHLGRVDPRTLGLRLDAWREPPAFPVLLREAAAAGRAAVAVDALAPPFVLYAQLLDALERYRALAAQPESAVPAFVRTIKPGEPYAGAHALGAHLAARGDLPAVDVPPPEATDYDGALAAGVRRFQTRHGLTPDGVLGKRTVAAALVPAAARVRQIVMALERLRWLPRLGARRLVAVNIPMFRLWAWDALGPVAAPVFSARVIVGQAMRTETPVFVETMDHVIFRPYWNVPASILRGEVLPAIRRNPDYLAREQMEIVDGQSDDAHPVPLGPDALEALAAGTLRVR